MSKRSGIEHPNEATYTDVGGEMVSPTNHFPMSIYVGFVVQRVRYRQRLLYEGFVMRKIRYTGERLSFFAVCCTRNFRVLRIFNAVSISLVLLELFRGSSTRNKARKMHDFT